MTADQHAAYFRFRSPARHWRPEYKKSNSSADSYIDPVTGDIYAVNNDTVDSLVIFSRKAVADVTPDRELHTPHGTFGIAVDEEPKNCSQRSA